MKFLYNLAIFLFRFLILITTPFNEKAKLFVRGRKGWKKILSGKVDPNKSYIWFHCASLGEFEQGRPVIEDVKCRFPEYKILLTFFSPSGYEVRKNYPVADIVCYLPVDTPKNARDFFDIVKPEKAFFIKYEYWFNFMGEAKKRAIPLYVVSAIFRGNQIFFKRNPAGSWFRKSLKSIEHFFVQDILSLELLAKIGYNNVSISGDTRFDRVAAIASSVKQIPVIEKFKAGCQLLVIGSSWPPDEELIIRFINQSKGLKFIIAPHEVTDSNLNRIKNALKKPVVLLSRADETDIASKEVILVDSVGLLSSLYQNGEVAYIGGGFGVGIHNILEAATFGLPVVFGPNFKKFKEANDLVKLGAAFPITNYEQMEQNLTALFSPEQDIKKLSVLTKEYINKNQGATQIIIKKSFSF